MSNTAYKELLEYYIKNYTKNFHHKALKNRLKSFEYQDLVEHCEIEIEQIEIKESAHNSSYLFGLIDYAKKVDDYFGGQRNRLLNYSLALGGFSLTYITSMLAGQQQKFISNEIAITFWAFIIVLVGCFITWFIYLVSLSPNHPHRKKSYSPYFFSYNVSKAFNYFTFNFIPKNQNKQETSIKAFNLDLTTFIKRNKELTDDYSSSYKATLTQAMMLFKTAQHKSKSANYMRNSLSWFFFFGITLYLILIFRAIL